MRHLSIKLICINLIILSVWQGTGYSSVKNLRPAAHAEKRSSTDHSIPELYPRLIIETREECKLSGLCQIHALVLLRKLTQDGIKGWIMSDGGHLWVETDGYVLDAFPQGQGISWFFANRNLARKDFVAAKKGSGYPEALRELYKNGQKDAARTQIAVSSDDGRFYGTILDYAYLGMLTLGKKREQDLQANRVIAAQVLEESIIALSRFAKLMQEKASRAHHYKAAMAAESCVLRPRASGERTSLMTAKEMVDRMELLRQELRQAFPDSVTYADVLFSLLPVDDNTAYFTAQRIGIAEEHADLVILHNTGLIYGSELVRGDSMGRIDDTDKKSYIILKAPRSTSRVYRRLKGIDSQEMTIRYSINDLILAARLLIKGGIPVTKRLIIEKDPNLARVVYAKYGYSLDYVDTLGKLASLDLFDPVPGVPMIRPGIAEIIERSVLRPRAAGEKKLGYVIASINPKDAAVFRERMEDFVSAGGGNRKHYGLPLLDTTEAFQIKVDDSSNNIFLVSFPDVVLGRRSSQPMETVGIFDDNGKVMIGYGYLVINFDRSGGNQLIRKAILEFYIRMDYSKDIIDSAWRLIELWVQGQYKVSRIEIASIKTRPLSEGVNIDEGRAFATSILRPRAAGENGRAAYAR